MTLMIESLKNNNHYICSKYNFDYDMIQYMVEARTMTVKSKEKTSLIQYKFAVDLIHKRAFTYIFILKNELRRKENKCKLTEGQ
jgi:hypothetical protein